MPGSDERLLQQADPHAVSQLQVALRLDPDVVAGIADRRHIGGAQQQIDAADVREADRSAAEDPDGGVGGRESDDLCLGRQREGRG